MQPKFDGFFGLIYTAAMPKPAVLFSPYATEQLKSGFDQMAKLLTGTLGPSQGIVLSTKGLGGPPELLNDAAMIARRVVALPERQQDVGAMILRQIVWRMRQRFGDGAALTAVLAQSLLHHIHKMRAAEMNPMVMQQGIRAAAETAVSTLRAMAEPATDWETLAAVGLSVTGHLQLGDILGELVELLGPNGHVTVTDHMAPVLDRTYLNGGRWAGKLISPYMMTATAVRQAVQSNVHVALYAGRLLNPAEELEVLLGGVAQSKTPHLLLVAYEFSDEVMNALVTTHTSEESKVKITAVKLTRGGDFGRDEMADIALLTGATVLGPDTGRKLTTVSGNDLGQAGRVEAGEQHFVMQQGAGNATQLREEIEKLESYASRLPPGDDDRARFQDRIGRLSGNAAILKVGAYTKAERTYLHQAAEQGVKAVQAAGRGGVVPGGGTAYLHCLAAVNDLAAALEGEARVGAKAVAEALQAPFAQLLRNGGVVVPALPQAEILAEPPGLLFDVMQGKLRQARAAGLMDAAEVTIGALETAVSGALMASSIETVVLKKKPKMVYEP
ncbi:MAG: TCP-1/cpn60 chaperonin family protein [Chloroflexota bacterium]